jgi:hypothetical protein
MYKAIISYIEFIKDVVSTSTIVITWKILNAKNQYEIYRGILCYQCQAVPYFLVEIELLLFGNAKTNTSIHLFIFMFQKCF